MRLAPAFLGGVSLAAADVNGDGRADIVTGPGAGGGPHVKLFSGLNQSLIREFLAYDPRFTGGVSVALGDINGDGVVDFVTGAGPGGGPHVRIFDGGSGQEIGGFLAFDPSFLGGVRVATGDIDGDGRTDIIAAAGEGGGPHVVVRSGSDFTVLRSFFAYGAQFTGGVWVASGDVNDDGRTDVITGAGSGGASHVVAWSGRDNSVLRSFLAYAPSFTGGVHVAAADLTGDDAADIITGPGTGGGPHVMAFDGRTGGTLTSFFAYATNFTGGVFVAAGDVNGDGRPEIGTGAGPGGGPHVRAFDFATGTLHADFLAYGDTQPVPVDTTAPVVTLSAPVDGLQVMGNITVVGRATDVGLGVDYVEAQFDSGPFFRVPLDANGNFSFPSTYPPDDSALGQHSVRVRAVDRAGLGSLVVSRTFTLVSGNFTDDLAGWTVAESGGTAAGRGTVAAASGRATMREGDSFRTTLTRAFTVPSGAGTLSFTYDALNFDTADPSAINDAFEVALIDESGNSLVPPPDRIRRRGPFEGTNPLVQTFAAGRDAFFNVTEGVAAAGGSAVTIAGSTVTLNLAGIPAGVRALLVFRLVNNDADVATSVRVGDVTLPTAAVAPGFVKFFVADAAADRAFRYDASGLDAGRFAIPTSLPNVRGVASILAGTRVWVVDAGGRVGVTGPTGTIMGSWQATGVSNPQGITVSGADLWIVDRATRQVLRFAAAANRTSGFAAADSSFALAADNASPSDLVTDGTLVWVTDDARAEVFVYSLAGALLGRWHLDAANAAASGITLDPSGGTEVWTVDRAARQVFRYAGGRDFRDGSRTATDTYRLDPANAAPEGIADPPQTPEGYSLLDGNGRATFDTADDFRQGTLFNLTAVDATGDIRLNEQGTTELPPFIWVSNSSEGSVSRFDTRTGVEVARYRTGPESLGARLSPSRTAVAGDGSVWVANRSNRDGVTPSSIIHVLLEGFVDRNGNGVVDTSTDLNQNGRIDPNEMRPWDANSDGQPDDERIAMSIGVGRNRNNPEQVLNNTIARAVAIDADDNVWVGLYNSQQYEVYDGATGSLLQIVPVSGTPYGAVIDGDGILWGATNSTTINRVDTNSRTALPNITNVDNYGITVGPDGAVWAAGYGTSRLTRIEPDTLATTGYTAPGFGQLRGVGVDDANNVWVATNSPNGVVRFHFDTDMRTLLSTQGVTVNGTATAAVVDADGFAWTTTQTTNLAYKIDPETVTVVPGWPIATGPEPYNYSDMTGRVRLGVTERTGTFTEIIDATRPGAVWGGVELDAFLPDPATSVVVRVRAADDAALLPQLAWRTVEPEVAYRDLQGRYLEVQVSLRSREPDFNPVVNRFSVVNVLPPVVDVTAPPAGDTVRANEAVVLTGVAAASQPAIGSTLFGPNRIVAVTVNGTQVDSMDPFGRFFARVPVLPGVNAFAITAYDEYGQSVTINHALRGETRTPGSVDFSQLSDLTASFEAVYARTSFHEGQRALYGDIVVANRGQYAAGVPLYVGVRNISDPTVRPLDTAGTLPDGTPYYDFTDLVTGGSRLEPNATTGVLSLAFKNPNAARFTYDLVFLGVLNRPPAFASVPPLEANPDRLYRYPSAATDPDGDPLTFALASGPVGMTVDATAGVVTWTPTADQLGNHEVVLRASDGRGGSAEQRFTVECIVAPPNRTPVFTTLPVIEANVGAEYRYDADATDADGDTLTYSLEAGFPAGMTIDSATGNITWTPAGSQIGDASVTVLADDGNGGIGRQTFTICVEAGTNRPPVIVSSPLPSVDADPAIAGDPQAFDLSTWEVKRFVYNTNTPPATWVIGDNNTSATQLFNSDPSFLLGDAQVGSERVEGTISVNTATDDDEIGFVFGYRDDQHFFLFNWAQGNENSDPGMVVRRYSANRPLEYALDWDPRVGHDSDAVTTIYRNTIPWQDLTPYRVQLDLLAGRFAIRVFQGTATVAEIELSDEAFQGGRFGFFEHSQQDVTFRGFTKTALSEDVYRYDVEALDPDGGPLTYSLTQAPAGMTIDSGSGLIDWTPHLPITSLAQWTGTGANGHYYAVTPDTMTWDEAHAIATQLGGHLVAIANQAESEFLQQTFFPTQAEAFWIGFTDREQEGNFRWTTGEPVTFTNWGAGEPNDLHGPIAVLTGEDYTAINWQVANGFGVRGQWNDAPNGGTTQNNTAFQPYRGIIEFDHFPTVPDAHVTVRVDDGRGGSDEQSFDVRVLDYGGIDRGFDPVVEWHKSTFTVRPGSNQVMMTPAVIDINADGTPDIVFSTFGDQGIAGGNAPGVLRAISGTNGAELWTATDPTYAVDGYAGIAAGDIDGDGQPEIFATDPSQTRVVAFHADGSGWWISPQITGRVGWGSAALADLDLDGTAEIVIGATVLNADGSVRWSGAGGLGNNGGIGPLSAVADLDMDGSPEVVAGRTAYHADGSVYWSAPLGDGFPAIGNFDADLFPEIVVVSDGNVYLLQHDGAVAWGPVAIPGGGRGGAPTIADFDNDGQPEIGVAGSSRYAVIETNGTVKWSSQTQDFSSNLTGSSVFDFDGDGQAEVVYGDELFLRIYRGTDGTPLYSLPNTSGTTYEYPVIADVDGDGNAEIVAVTNNHGGQIGVNGVRVIGDRNNTWVNTRKIWNQHTYHVTNVNDDGTIPTHGATSWLEYNSYRTNVLTEGFDPRLAPDLLITAGTVTVAGGVYTFTGTVRNQATAPANPGATVVFYVGSPDKGGRLIGTTATTLRLRRGESETVSVTFNELVNDLWIRVDPANVLAEVNEFNNDFRAGIDTDPVNYAPRYYSGAGLPNAVMREAFRFTLPVVDPDGDPIAYTLVTGPDGMQVHPTLGVLAWHPFRDQIGTHQVVIQAADDHGHSTLRAFDVTVVAPNSAPVVTSTAPAGPATVGLPYQYAVLAQDAEQTALTYSLVGPLPGMAIDAAGVFTWMPAVGDIGSHLVTVRVDDGASGVTEHVFAIAVAVTATNHAPAATLDVRTSAWVDRDYVGRVLASDSDGDPLTFTLVNGPADMVIDAAGIIRWHPTALAAAPIAIEIQVSDGRPGGTTTLAYELSVANSYENTPPVITSVPRITGTSDSLYSYDLVARDDDGDPVFFTLVTAPHGMSLDSLRGTIRWVPCCDDSGSVPVTVRVTDVSGASSDQSFTIFVSCVNQPPRITSVPVTVGNANFTYAYAVRAVDPEGDPLTFSFDTAPAGMAFLPGTSIIRWTPTLAQVGPQTVTVRVADQAGNSVTQSFAVDVDERAPNRAPVITSQPRTIATIGRLYEYTVTAADPDGDPLEYTLLAGPAGMTIDPATGRVTWTATEAGQVVVTLSATDDRGAQAIQSFTLTARENLAPTITSTAPTAGTVGGVYRYDVQATDPDPGEVLSYALAAAPEGMTIDGFGRIRWTPTADQLGPNAATVVVRDSSGAEASQTFTVTVAADTTAPNVTVYTSYSQATIGTVVTFRVVATDNVAVASLGLTVGGVAVALDALGQATRLMDTAGLIDVVGTATDTSGNVGTATVRIRIFDPDDMQGPDVAITRLDTLTPSGIVSADPRTTNVTVGYVTDIIGTVDDPDDQLDNWAVYIAPSDRIDQETLDLSDPDWREIGRGTAEVTDGRLATLDPTALANGDYAVVVAAFDASGQGTIRGILVGVAGNAKLGNFRLEFTDLSIPIVGIPVTITRVYDTLQSSEIGSFGYGWSLGIQNGQIRETVPQTGDGFFTTGAPFRQGTRVYVTNPRGERVGFKFEPTVSGSLFGAVYHPAFTADPGVTDRLEVDDLPLSLRSDGTFGAFLFGFPYNPDDYRLTTTDGLTYRYNQFSGLQTVADRNGNTLTYTAGGVQHSTGESIQFVRDGQGRITSIIDPADNAITYAYTAAGDLASVTDQAGQVTTFRYKPARPHYLDEVRDPLGRRAVKTEYDDNGRIVAIIDALGNRVEQDFDPANFTGVIRDARGNATTLVYNDRGNVLQQTDPEGGVTTFEYADPANPDKETRVVKQNGGPGLDQVTTFTYDSRGNTLTVTTAAGTTTNTYNAQNKLTSTTDPLARVTAYTYDAANKLTGLVNAVGLVTSLTYDAQGRATSYTDFNGGTTNFIDLSPSGTPHTIINPDGSVRQQNMNAFGQITNVTDERGFTKTNEYDEIGRLRATTDGEGHRTTYEYEGKNLTRLVDPLGNVTRYEYDAANRRTRVVDAEGGITVSTYDASGNLLSLTDPIGNVTRYVYDTKSRVVEEIDPLGKSTFTTYDDVGNKLSIIDRNGRRRTFEYDQLSRQTAEKWWDGAMLVRTITHTYDAAGNLLTAGDPDSQLSYTYDALNRVTTATTIYPNSNAGAFTLTYTYDANGNSTNVVDSAGVAVGSVYSGRNELLSRTWQGGGIDPTRVDFDYFANGTRQSATRYADLAGTQVVGASDYDYFANGLSKSITHRAAGNSLIADYRYTYDAAGRLVAESHPGDVYAYGYDRIDQLLTVTKNGSLFESFTYDANGNRETSTGPNGSQSYAPAGAGNRLLNDGVYQYAYDDAGNLTTKTEIASGRVSTYVYDSRNRLIEVTDRTAGGVLLSESQYVYDALDRRVASSVNGAWTYMTYDGGNSWADMSAGGTVVARYLFDGRLDGLLARWRAADGIAHYLTDRLGSVRNVMTAAGGTTLIDYSAFGTPQFATPPVLADRFLFAGREYDNTTGLYHNRARLFDARAGRFTQVDPSGFRGDDANLFRYTGNSPTNAIDPSGRFAVLSYAQTIQFSLAIAAQITLIFNNALKLVPGYNTDPFGYDAALEKLGLDEYRRLVIETLGVNTTLVSAASYTIYDGQVYVYVISAFPGIPPGVKLHEPVSTVINVSQALGPYSGFVANVFGALALYFEALGMPSGTIGGPRLLGTNTAGIYVVR